MIKKYLIKKKREKYATLFEIFLKLRKFPSNFKI